MPKKSSERHLGPLLVLYAVNISQPCSREELYTVLSAGGRFSGIGHAMLDKRIGEILEYLQREDFVTVAGDGDLVVTYRGLKSLSERGIGYPRDMYRLYYLKDKLRQRGQ